MSPRFLFVVLALIALLACVSATVSRVAVAEENARVGVNNVLSNEDIASLWSSSGSVTASVVEGGIEVSAASEEALASVESAPFFVQWQ